VKSQRWCVVGGGMLGLSMARSLAIAGESVEVWEAGDDLGGLVTPWSIGGVTWDRFYHVITSNDEYLLRLLRSLNLEKEICWKSLQTGFYTDMHLYPFSTLFDFLCFPPLNPIDKLRLGTTILRAAHTTDPLPLEKITAVQWLTELSGNKLVERIWLPLLRAKLGVNAERVNAAFIWAIIARMYGARQGKGKRELFGYVPGGYRRILSNLTSRLNELGIITHTGRPVSRVRLTSAERIAVDYSGNTAQFDRVVITVPAPAAAEMCPDLLPNETNRLRGIEYQGVVCASLLLNRPLSPYYITNITDRMPFTAVIEMDALVDAGSLGDYALVYLPKYVPSNDPTFERDDESIRREFIAALNRIHPNFGMNDVSAFRVSRARYVQPISTIGYSDRMPPFTTTLKRVYTVNSAQIVNGTLNVNQTLELAERAFASIRDDAALGHEQRAPQYI
jgi:protoporphyrinogen oxidase